MVTAEWRLVVGPLAYESIWIWNIMDPYMAYGSIWIWIHTMFFLLSVHSMF